MRFWEYFILFVLGLLLVLAIAWLQPAPGYMDADYYFAGGIQLVSGKGASEPFLWNYLDDPTRLPHPAFTYWMPLAALLAAAGMGLTGEMDFFSARLVFFVLAGCIPALTAWLSYRLTRRRVSAWTAGGLAIFSGYYAVYLGLTETFTIYMLLGTTFLVTAASSIQGLRKALLLGALAGLMHLARADGVLWLGLGAVVLIFPVWKDAGLRNIRRWIMPLAVLGATYFLVMGLWYGRNLVIFGNLFSPGSGRTLWLLDYDQLYNFPAGNLNWQNWLSAGAGVLFGQRWDAFVGNIQTFLAVQCSIFLLPLVAAGFYRLRKQAVVVLGVGMWVVTFVVMTLVFPLPGLRGGFLHSGAAFQPLIWALAAEGLLGFIDLGVRWRNWKMTRASIGFGLLMLFVAALLTVGLSAGRLLSDDPAEPAWSASERQYAALDQTLDRMGIPAETVILVNNPPGFYLASGRASIVIPNGGMDVLLAAAGKFDAQYLLLEENTVKGLRFLYDQPANYPGIQYLQTAGKIRLFKIVAP